jgi:hypothetical protein
MLEMRRLACRHATAHLYSFAKTSSGPPGRMFLMKFAMDSLSSRTVWGLFCKLRLSFLTTDTNPREDYGGQISFETVIYRKYHAITQRDNELCAQWYCPVGSSGGGGDFFVIWWYNERAKIAFQKLSDLLVVSTKNMRPIIRFRNMVYHIPTIWSCNDVPSISNGLVADQTWLF